MPQIPSDVPQTHPQAQVPVLLSLMLLLLLGSTGQIQLALPSSNEFSLLNPCTTLSGSIFFCEESPANEQDCKCLFCSAEHEQHPTAEHHSS